MKIVLATLIALMTLSSSLLKAQELPRKVTNVNLTDLDENKVQIPHWCEKNIMIFYVDPDRPSQNNKFITDLKNNNQAKGDNLARVSIINLADAPMIPNRMAMLMAKKHAEGSGDTVLTDIILADEVRAISKAWALGDCDNKFVLLLISKEAELIFMRKGELSKDDIDEFYKVIVDYK